MIKTKVSQLSRSRSSEPRAGAGVGLLNCWKVLERLTQRLVRISGSRCRTTRYIRDSLNQQNFSIRKTTFYNLLCPYMDGQRERDRFDQTEIRYIRDSLVQWNISRRKTTFYNSLSPYGQSKREVDTVTGPDFRQQALHHQIYQGLPSSIYYILGDP